MSRPIATTMRRTAWRPIFFAAPAPRYPPETVPTVMTAAKGQSTMPPKMK